MARGPEVIVLSSDDEDSSESERDVHTPSVPPSQGKKKANSASAGDYGLSRDEQYLLAADLEDESDASDEEDDDYDDGDDSFGDGSRAFARKRRSSSGAEGKRKRPSQPPPDRKRPAARNETSRTKNGKRAADVEPYRHSDMVRQMAEARDKRARLAEKGVRAEVEGRRGGAVHATKKKPEVTAVKRPREDGGSTAVRNGPMTARKSALMRSTPGGVMRPSKRPRWEEESEEESEEEEAEDEDSSEQTKDEEEEEESSEEDVRLVKTPPRPKKPSRHIDSSDSDDSETYLPAARRSPPRKKTIDTSKRKSSGEKPPTKSKSQKEPVARDVAPNSKPRSTLRAASPPRRPPRAPVTLPERTRSKADSTPSARPSGGVASLPENMSFAEMQEQERQLAYFQSLKKRKDQEANNAPSRSSKSSDRQPSVARKAAPTQRHVRKDSTVSVESFASSTVLREPKALARQKAPSATVSPFVPPPLRAGFSANINLSVLTTTVMAATDASLAIAATDNVDHVPLPHTTDWRRKRFIRAPINLMPLDSACADRKIIAPFATVDEHDLRDYDDSGLIPPKAELFMVPEVTTSEVLLQSYETQESVTSKVRRVIKKYRPTLEKAHKTRVQEIISSMRTRLPWNDSTTTTHSLWTNTTPVGPLVPPHERSPIEHVFAKRIQQKIGPRVKSIAPDHLVGKVVYVYGVPSSKTGLRHDESKYDVTEFRVFPETIIEFGHELPPIRRACTWISVKTNVHVEDNPILRYIPHLGEDTRVNIDPKRYHRTTLDKNRDFVVEGNARDEKDAELVKKELESWETDLLGLATEVPGVMDDEVKEHLLCLVVKHCGRSEGVFQVLRGIGGFAEPLTDYDQIQKREDARRLVNKRLDALQRCLTIEGDNTISEDAKIRGYISRLTSEVSYLPFGEADTVSHRLQPPPSSLATSYVRNLDGKGVRQGNNFGHLVEWYRDLFCRRCFTYDCQQHGIQHPQPTQRMDPRNPVVNKSGVGLSRRKQVGGHGDFSSSTQVIEINTSSSSSSEESQPEDENDDAQSTMSGSVEGDGDTGEARRSRRSNTRASTMASASLKVQEVMVEKERRKQQRKLAKQLKKLIRPLDDSEYLDDSYRGIVGRKLDGLLSAEPDAACGDQCWKLQKKDGAEITLVAVSEVGRVMLRKLISILGDDACVMARLLQDPLNDALNATDSCTAIHRFIESEKRIRDGSSSNPSHDSTNNYDESRDGRGRRQNRRAGHSGDRALIKQIRTQRAQQQEKEREHRYEPCRHDGVCSGDCDCMKRGHDCDFACCCSRDCANRSHGCKCLPGQCRTQACECYKNGRECDPDLCFSCGAHEAAVMEFDGKQRVAAARDVGICQNVSLLRGVHKKIGVAFSATHGWGAYALEPIRKGEFVYEYTGALISDDEAERRGNIYDAMLVSFLFDVNSDDVVDAMRKGNKIKFANHRERETANLVTKILVVRGDHRIALFAKWDLHVGDELFFDYGYTNETAPAWSQLRTPHNTKCMESDLDDDDDEELVEVLQQYAVDHGLDDD